MAVLRESPWYAEILQEGIEQGQMEMLLHILHRRFGPLPPDLVARIGDLRLDQLGQVVDVALEAPTLAVVKAFVATLAANGPIESALE